MKVIVPASEVAVLAQADVVVCGAGCAGVTAAISAARAGCSVILLERWPSVGGMATNGLVNCWHRSDREKVVINGLAEESTARALKENWAYQVADFPASHETHWFDPEGMRIIWQRMLDEANVRTLCHLTVGEPMIDEGVLRGVLVDTKRGRRAVLGRMLIDATGDGDVAAKAGIEFEYGRKADGKVQGMTMMFSLRDVDETLTRAISEAKANAIVDDMIRLRDAGQFPPFNEGNTRGLISYWKAANFVLWNMCPAAGDPLDEEELSRLSAETREYIATYLAYWRQHVPGMAKAKINQTAFCMGIRESRRMRGLKQLDRDMVLGAVKHEDAIGHGVWMVDIHDPLGTGHTTYTDRNAKTMLVAGTSYHIPLGMCLNERYDNLAVVGRCAWSTHEAHASVRVQSHCMVMGQGLGLAAAIALESGIGLKDVNVKTLQKCLRAQGVYLQDVPT